jgi:anti-sigma regulatory factor (Ser/Thr protein kinase)
MVAMQLAIQIQDDSQIGSARRQALRLADTVKLGELLRSRVGIIATELATNLLRHGSGGTLLLQETGLAGEPRGVEMLAVDRGRGIGNLGRAMQDGHSTGGTMGTGLGAVRRLSTEFDVFSEPGKGTVVLSRLSGDGSAGIDGSRWGAVATSAPGETVSGDAWRLIRRAGLLALMVADGLGHGVLAEQAALEAARLFETAFMVSPVEYLARAHDRLRRTRGAAIAVAQCDLQTGSVCYAGIGNITGMLVSRDGHSRHLLSLNGTVGGTSHAGREMPYQWDAGELLIVHSDGLSTMTPLHDRPGLAARHPAVIAAVLHRDLLRGRDDATIVVVERSSPGELLQ